MSENTSVRQKFMSETSSKPMISILAALIGAGGAVGGAYIGIIPGPKPTQEQIVTSREYKLLVEESATRLVEIGRLNSVVRELEAKLRDQTVAQDVRASAPQPRHTSEPIKGELAPIAGMWEGRSISGNSQITLSLDLSEKSRGMLDGFVNIPEEGNVILQVTGRRVTAPDDFVDRTRWLNLTIPSAGAGVFFSLSTIKVVQASYANGLPWDGLYRCMINSDGVMKIVLFWHKDDAKPKYILELTKH